MGDNYLDAHRPLTPNSKTELDEKTGTPNEGFHYLINVNLRDAFNSYINNYTIALGQTELFTYTAFLESIRHTKPPKPGNWFFPKETGAKQVFLISDEGERLYSEVASILTQCPNWFSKKFQNGVSFKFIPIKDLGKFKDQYRTDPKKKFISIIDHGRYKDIYQSFPEFFSKIDIIAYNSVSSIKCDFNGLTRTIHHLEGLPTDQSIDIFSISSGISAFSELLFCGDKGHFIHLGGDCPPAIREQLISLPPSITDINDLYIFSLNKNPSRLSDLIDTPHCIFMHTRALKYVTGTLAGDSINLIRDALKCGVKIHRQTYQH